MTTTETARIEIPDQQRQQRMAVLDTLLSGGKVEDLMADLRARAEENNRAAQLVLPLPATQPESDWTQREAWLHDGQPILGELKLFAWEAYRAAKAGDQVAFSRQRDLLYKAVLTFVGLPPAEEVVEEVVDGAGAGVMEGAAA